MFKRNDNMWLYALAGALIYNLGKKHGTQQVLQAGLPGLTGQAPAGLPAPNPLTDPIRITLRITQI